jgi:DNA-binding response OmpR family regulator
MSKELDMRLLLSGISVLVVDDNLETLELFDLFLTQSGATVATAITVETALKTMEEFFPDILITDLKLPDGNGYALLDMVRNLQSG